ncbi:enoyl-CoA hydratase/isomerase family protein [Pedobacter sp. UBA4863]|uniref:enoyl-CoA hydratase/isomerase family protein n=1 Tax=Pedobacter sp. UBA4863 TaxID=1947060 RepID=UPI0025D30E09|nr:enoyl-CoA hydratase/isomerase family protein [Pedobacter sp. UBA4863]
MNTISTSVKDRLAIITLNRGRANALNREMVTELQQMLINSENDDNIGGVIITGRENFFSAGLDLLELYHYNEEEIKSFWNLFLEFSAKITAFKKPLVAAINGHSPAGGCVIALACDARVMAEGKFIIGLNEVPVGIVVPNSIFHLYSFWLGQGNAYRNLLEGKLFSPEEALAVGLVDEVVKSESIMTAAERKVRKYMAFEANTWQQSKLNLRKDVIAVTSANQSEDLEVMLKQWWSMGTRAILKSLVEGLKAKS